MIKKATVVFVVAFIICFLANSFIALSINPSDWERGARALNMILPAIVFGIRCFVPIMEGED